MVCYEGKVSLYCFFSTAVTFILIFIPNITYNYLSKITGALILGPLLFFVSVHLVTLLIYRGNAYQIGVRAVFLGFVFSLGLFLKIHGSNNVDIFGVYMCIMATFHYTEFLSIAVIHPKLVTIDSYVINHSPQYIIAAVTSWLEFFIEFYFFPSVKSAIWLSNVGLVVCIFGELLRKSAMLTAKSNFNHLVQCEKAKDHVLVTHGVYSMFRHPSYVGWFYWSVGTQLVLLNPLCVVAYAYASWRFFKERIYIEEITLLNFFGQQYCDYQQKVSIGIPFIQGYRIKP